MKILVVLSDAHRKEGADALMLKKAAALANDLGASLELLRVAYDRTLEVSMFLKSERLDAARSGILAEERRWVSELAENLEAQGLSIRYDVRWDHPRSTAVLRKVDEERFDWVMKEPADDRFALGMHSNTDWDLIRECPVPVYFVKGPNPPAAGVLVALEGCVAEPGSEESDLDYEVYRQGRRIAEAFDTPLTVVHAYQVPRQLPAYLSYAPLVSDTIVSPAIFDSLSQAEREEHQAVAEQHGQAIRAFAEYFGYPVADIVIREGAPDMVIADEAHRRQSGLIVMGAAEAGSLDRLFRRVTAEPALAVAECDLLFVKPTSIGQPQAAMSHTGLAFAPAQSDIDGVGAVLDNFPDPASHQYAKSR